MTLRPTLVLPVVFCSILSPLLAASHGLLIDGAFPAGEEDLSRESGPVKSILESTGLFQIESVNASGAFQTRFERYKLIVLNFGGDGWPLATLTALDKYLQSGGGMLALPGSGSAFPDSPAFNVMLGLTAAHNRNRQAGPFWFYKDGNVAYDNTTEGAAGKIIRVDQPFPITIRDTEHPVTKGLPLVWMHLPDEIAGRLRGPGKNMTLLATAFSDPKNGGTGLDEPQVVAVAYGKGRVFRVIMGRTPKSLDCAGLQTILQRGAEWAATGKVTQKLPSDFPTEEKESQRASRSAQSAAKDSRPPAPESRPRATVD
ncbi:MAG TPA: ThuA domain-containing protein [Bryobacteraceae bacterium]|nr:ThuA domain-containing protein [Bryobacteraceae bacterium]